MLTQPARQGCSTVEHSRHRPCRGNLTLVHRRLEGADLQADLQARDNPDAASARKINRLPA